MHYVREIPFGVLCKTRIWFSDAVSRVVDQFRRKGDPDGRFWRHLRRCAQNGLWLYERGRPSPVIYEWDQVYRIGFDHSLFRIIGFYEDGSNKTSFIAIDAFLKRGQDLSQAEQERIDEVVRVKQNNLWRKITQ